MNAVVQCFEHCICTRELHLVLAQQECAAVVRRRTLAEELELDGSGRLTLGRSGRTTLSTDGLLPQQGIFAPLPGAPAPLSGAVWTCTCKVAAPPEAKATATWQSSASRSTAALPMSRLLPRSIVLVDAVAPVAVTACWSENWFCESMSMEEDSWGRNSCRPGRGPSLSLRASQIGRAHV